LVGSAGLGVGVAGLGVGVAGLGVGVGVALGPQAARIVLTATSKAKIVNSERFIFTLLLCFPFFGFDKV
jgi:proteasome assembly chaperone (PAC2) family protein